ncbi:MAG TPA: TatD family hydrolase [Gaiellales bacterium]
MIDTHAHLDLCEGAAEDLVDAAAAAGVGRILTVGRDQALALAERFASVWAIVGIHPHEAADAVSSDSLRPLLAHPRAVAVGECGLDFFRDYAPRADQLRVFEAQIALANETGLPLVIHTRAADEDTFRMLKAAEVPVLLHCFSSVDRLDEAIERGYFCSFAGNVAFPGAADLRAAAARVPDDRILAETDCPYLAPPPHRGRPNQPAYAAITLGVLARERDVSEAALGEQIDRNADRLFAL